jgi:hypothetical protein
MCTLVSFAKLRQAIQFYHHKGAGITTLHRTFSIMDTTADKEHRLTLVPNTRIVYPAMMFGDGINAPLRLD